MYNTFIKIETSFKQIVQKLKVVYWNLYLLCSYRRGLHVVTSLPVCNWETGSAFTSRKRCLLFLGLLLVSEDYLF